MWSASIALAFLLCSSEGLGFETASSGTSPDGNHTDSDGPLTVGQYPYHAKMDENYEIKWTFNSTHIMFELRVKTNGYIGFGISDHGAMYPSDVIIAWVKDGQVHFADRHASGHFMPAVDSQQDWLLVNGKEEGDFTTVTTIRPLDTCDDQDMPISAGTSRLIYSYSPADPQSDDAIYYHGNSRGTKSILLLDPPPKEEEKGEEQDDGIVTMDILNRNYSVPSADTTYSCVTWKIPPLKGKHHLIRYEPVIQKGHEDLVHHIVVYYCSQPVSASLVGTHHMCYHNEPEEFRSCQHAFLAWAIGGTAFDYPAHVGHSLGGSDDPVYFKMETHYNNVHMRSDYVDSSGIRLIISPKLRTYDAGMLEVGSSVDPYMIIPPYYPEFLSGGSCHPSCLEKAMGDKEEIYIFADLLHAHLLGRSLRLRQIRGGRELPPVLEDPRYDFDYQEQRKLRKERAVRKGDTLIMDCVYDSSKKTRVTFGGLSTRQEMCLSFILYYPRTPLTGCLTRPVYNQSNRTEIFSHIKQMDWTQQHVRDAFAKQVDQSGVSNICLNADENNGYQFFYSSRPNITVPYRPESQCNK